MANIVEARNALLVSCMETYRRPRSDLQIAGILLQIDKICHMSVFLCNFLEHYVILEQIWLSASRSPAASANKGVPSGGEGGNEISSTSITLNAAK